MVLRLQKLKQGNKKNNFLTLEVGVKDKCNWHPSVLRSKRVAFDSSL